MELEEPNGSVNHVSSANLNDEHDGASVEHSGTTVNGTVNNGLSKECVKHAGKTKADDTSHSSEGKSEKVGYKLYKSRWLMLAIVCFLNLSNAMMWITFAAAADTTITFYGITSIQLNMLSMTFMFATVPLGFVATWVLDTYGLRASLLLAAWLNGLGGLLRNISTLSIIPHEHAYSVLMIGQALAACAQPFVMFTPTKLAALWFPENRRATANMIGSMSSEPFREHGCIYYRTTDC